MGGFQCHPEPEKLREICSKDATVPRFKASPPISLSEAQSRLPVPVIKRALHSVSAQSVRPSSSEIRGLGVLSRVPAKGFPWLKARCEPSCVLWTSRKKQLPSPAGLFLRAARLRFPFSCWWPGQDALSSFLCDLSVSKTHQTVRSSLCFQFLWFPL